MLDLCGRLVLSNMSAQWDLTLMGMKEESNRQQQSHLRKVLSFCFDRIAVGKVFCKMMEASIRGTYD
jgi:hypothetical protein